MSKRSKERKTCLGLASTARADQRMYQQAADNAPGDGVRHWNQQRADWAAEKAATYERWLEENR